MIEEIIFLFQIPFIEVSRVPASPITGISLSEAVRTVTKIPVMFSFSGNCGASIPISTTFTFCERLIQYIPRIGPNISCCRIGTSIVGIYKSLTDTWLWKLRLWPSNSFSGNICCEFLVLVSLQCVPQKAKFVYSWGYGRGGEEVRGLPTPYPPPLDRAAT